MGKLIDLTGQKFGKLTVLRQAETDNHHTRWLARCECGRETIVYGHDLKRGKTVGCGSCRKKKEERVREFPTEKTDCFAHLDRGVGYALCTALTTMVCRTGECKFYSSVYDVCSKCKSGKCESCLTVCDQKQAEELE